MRSLREEDHERIISIVDEWWGRPMRDKIPRLFFRHFEDTSFAVEEDGEIIAFLIGFVSQSRPDEAYIHFVGVHPEYRGRGMANSLYERFFDEARKRGRTKVRCVTSPVNETSIAFHRSLGFAVETVPNYEGAGGAMVVFERDIRGG